MFGHLLHPHQFTATGCGDTNHSWWWPILAFSGRVADVGNLAIPTVHQRGTVLQRLIQTAYRLDLAARSISCNKFWWSCIIIEVC
jgi:hypothetical protein